MSTVILRRAHALSRLIGNDLRLLTRMTSELVSELELLQTIYI